MNKHFFIYLIQIGFKTCKLSVILVIDFEVLTNIKERIDCKKMFNN